MAKRVILMRKPMYSGVERIHAYLVKYSKNHIVIPSILLIKRSTNH